MTASSQPISPSSPIMASSPLVSRVVDKRRKLHQSGSKWQWSLANLAGAFLAFVEARLWHFLVSGASGWRSFFTGIEFSLVTIFLLNFMLDAVNHFFPYFNIKSLLFGSPDMDSTDVVLTKKQMNLFGIDQSDYGFKLADPKKASQTEGHAHGFGPPLDGSFIAPSPSYNPKSSSFTSMDSSSWHYQATQPVSSPEVSPKPVESYRPKFNSSFSEIKSEKSLQLFLREYDDWERSYGNISNVSMQAEGADASQSSLNVSGWRTPSQQPQQQPPRQDFSPFLRKMAYQVSSPLPEIQSDPSPRNQAEKLPKSPADVAAHDSVCARLNVGHFEVVDYLEKLRLWISQTVLKRIVDEIDQTNRLLVKHGMSDERIGLIGIEKLKKVALMPHILHHVPSMDAMVPFLDFHPNQEYLVQRYRELSSGGAMSDFRWNSGGKFKGSEWNDKLPTDAELVMSCLSAYLDTRLPRNFVSDDGKPFTGVYYLKYAGPENGKLKTTDSANKKTPESLISKLSPEVQALLALSPKKPAEKSESTETQQENPPPDHQTRGCTIVQCSQKPPSYELHLISDKTSKSKGDKVKINVGPGRNNLFYTLLLFLYHVKNEEHGTLGRIHFGTSGVNLLRVIGCND